MNKPLLRLGNVDLDGDFCLAVYDSTGREIGRIGEGFIRWLFFGFSEHPFRSVARRMDMDLQSLMTAVLQEEGEA